MDEGSFKLAYREYCDNEGTSCDPWDVEMAWRDYKKDPNKFDYLQAK